MAKNSGKGPYQSALTGKFVTTKYANSNPGKTVGHRPPSKPSSKKGK